MGNKIERVIDGQRIWTDEATSARLGRIPQTGTKPELAVRRLVYSLGHRYRVANRDLPGSPDIANRSRRWAIFVHGCYWHRHPGCARATTPTRNRDFWLSKFDRNTERDREAISSLERVGFRVLVVWECDVAPGGLAVEPVRAFLGRQ